VDKLERVRSYLTDCQTCRRRSVLFFREHTFLRREPATMTCPNCLCGIETAVERRATMKTHLSALLLLPVCLCVFPYYSKELRDTLHRCPACGVHLGSNFASVREACIVCAGHRHRHNAEDDAGQQHL
ncbi:uncharacterized protein LOC106647698, partial [Copidosoma floridanum]|uniref:uncharacterized protein LOC106647698 n=1 Tax=Copidosoma floridanum TaxID=29053 RepID=UPI000C6F8FFD